MARTLSTRRKKMAGMDNRRTDGRREDGKTLWYAARVVTWGQRWKRKRRKMKKEGKRGKKREKEERKERSKRRKGREKM